jgi:hypothetical protein
MIGLAECVPDLGTPLAIPHRWCWPSGPDPGERWPSRLVATAEEDRLSFQQQRANIVCGTQRPS